jgi:uncharacterized protein (TIGR02996 family)
MTTTQDKKALLRAIFENPDDDAPRLIYADVIQELGCDAEAERIRNAVANPQMTKISFLPLFKQANFRLDRHEHPDMSAAFSTCMAYSCRGFIDEVVIRHDDFMVNFERIFLCHPIRTIKIADRSPYMNGWFVEGTNDPRYGWGIQTEIHKAIFQALPMKSNAHPCFEHYGSPDKCHAALSDACVALGRHSNSLPMMPSYRYLR